MIDNVMHQRLCEAADEAGWNEESMMLHATRFLGQLACDNPDVEQRFQDYLREQIAEEALESQDHEPGEVDRDRRGRRGAGHRRRPARRGHPA